MRTVLFALFLYTGAAFGQATQDHKLKELQNEKDQALLSQKLHQLGNGTEEDLDLLMSYHMKDRSKYDSLRQVAIKRFPKGSQAYRSTFNVVDLGKPGAELEAKYLEFKKNFPGKDFDPHNSLVAVRYIKEKNVKKAFENLELIENPNVRASTVDQVVKYADGTEPDAIESMIKKELNRARKVVGNMDHYYSVSLTYSRFLMKKKELAEALKYMEDSYKNLTEKEALSRDYGYLLSVNGRHQEASPLMEKLVKSGYADEILKDQLSKTYIELNPGKDVKAYMASLTKSLNSVMKDKVAKIMVNNAAPNFKVKDVNGKEVSLADYKGKTVVVDFWATWCGPCVAALPAMQRVVDKYREDPNVKFLFIHTLDHSGDPFKEAKNYFAKKNFRLDLFIDPRDQQTKDSPAHKSFGIKGIPYKIVINGEGRIRFITSGFDNGDDALVEELSIMIEMTKESKV